MGKINLEVSILEMLIQKKINIKLLTILILIIMMALSANVFAQTPQGIGKFKIMEYTLDSLFSEYEFSDLRDSKNNFAKAYTTRILGGSENYEIIWDGGHAYYETISENIDNKRIFSISNYSVAGLNLKGLNLYFYEGVLYEILIQNNIEPLLEKLIIKYPNIEKDSTDSEKVIFLNAFGAIIEKPGYSREGNWHDENGIYVSFYDKYYHNDSGEPKHIERINIYNSENYWRIFEMERILRKKEMEKRETEQKILDDEL